MLIERTKMITVSIDIEEYNASQTEHVASVILTRLKDSKEICEHNPYLNYSKEYKCSFCGLIDTDKKRFFDGDKLSACCDEALAQHIKENEHLLQIVTDPENQPNQYSIGLCPCGKIYEQSNPLLYSNRMCESCLDAESVGTPSAVPVV